MENNLYKPVHGLESVEVLTTIGLSPLQARREARAQREEIRRYEYNSNMRSHRKINVVLSIIRIIIRILKLK